MSGSFGASLTQVGVEVQESTVALETVRLVLAPSPWDPGQVTSSVTC